jgi:hypothetical protein
MYLELDFAIWRGSEDKDIFTDIPGDAGYRGDI